VAVGEQFAAVVEHYDAVAQQAPALPGLVGHEPCCQMIGCLPSRAPRLVMTHGFPPSGDFVLVSLLSGARVSQEAITQRTAHCTGTTRAADAWTA
jgi:hypothetical protein